MIRGTIVEQLQHTASGLPPFAMLMAVHLHESTNTTHTYQYLQGIFGVSMTQIRDAIYDLEEVGFVEVTKTDDSHPFGSAYKSEVKWVGFEP